MKIFFSSIVILSIICGLNARSIHDCKCHDRIFPESSPREIQYVYTGGSGSSCSCPKHQYHDIILERPYVIEEKLRHQNYEFGIEVPQQKRDYEDVERYMFDVRIEKPEEQESVDKQASYSYKLQAPQTVHENSSPSFRYIFDTRIEEPIQPCKEKPWQGLVSQVDRIVSPERRCWNSDHTPETCNCGCLDATHTPSTCTCGESGPLKLPISFKSVRDSYHPSLHELLFPESSGLASLHSVFHHSRSKRETSPEKKSSSKNRDSKTKKLKPLKKISIAELVQEKNEKAFFKTKSSKKSNKISSRSKRRPNSGCSYTYDSCDGPRNGGKCPKCYRCKCEPVQQDDPNPKFSPRDIRVPYKIVSADEAPNVAPTNQEFDFEPPSYTGLKEQDMYRKYIQQIIQKYPDHMSRKMPDVLDQQRDLMDFVGELSKNNKSQGRKMENEDVRYKMMDNAMDFYKYYEQAANILPKNKKDAKLFRKRGTVLEVIELDPEEFSGKYAVAHEGFGESMGFDSADVSDIS